MRQFAASPSKDGACAPALNLPRRSEMTSRNNEFFIRNDGPTVQRYGIDLDALKKLTSQVVVAGERDGREFFPHLSASRLAEILGTGLREFPGNHGGYAIYPAEFARSLHQVFQAASSKAALSSAVSGRD
jgi:hypothetical protein